MVQFNRVCQQMMDWAFDNQETDRLVMHAVHYHKARDEYPDLRSGLIQKARDIACRAYQKLGFGKRLERNLDQTIQYDQRTIKVYLESKYVTMSTVRGRKRYTFEIAEHFNKYSAWKVLSAFLTRRGRSFVLRLIVHKDREFQVGREEKLLGIDLGINKIACCSDNSFYGSGRIKGIKGRYQHLKAELQSKGTRSAKRKLKEIGGRERRFVRDVKHCLAKELVGKPYDVFVLEDLGHIKKKDRGRTINRIIGGWSCRQLRDFITYKAEEAGKDVVLVNPKNTSITCSRCGNIDKANRTYGWFECLECGFSLDADLNASRNIAVLGRSHRGRLLPVSQM
jgi:IS605 OrfB family transposase